MVVPVKVNVGVANVPTKTRLPVETSVRLVSTTDRAVGAAPNPMVVALANGTVAKPRMMGRRIDFFILICGCDLRPVVVRMSVKYFKNLMGRAAPN